MRSCIAKTAICIVVALLFTIPAAAQPVAPQCPLGVTNPLQVIVGTWAYRLQGGVAATTPFTITGGSAAHRDSDGGLSLTTTQINAALVGRFTTALGSGATVGINRQGIGGVLIGNETDNYAGEVVPEQAITGIYTVDADCSGGTITLVGNSDIKIHVIQFVLSNNNTHMYLTNIDTNGQVFSGDADMVLAH